MDEPGKTAFATSLGAALGDGDHQPDVQRAPRSKENADEDGKAEAGAERVP